MVHKSRSGTARPLTIESPGNRRMAAGMGARFFLAAMVFASAAPAMADAGAQVPEGSNLTLFGLGILGVIIGRRFATRRKRD